MKSKLLWKSLLVTPAILGTALLVSASAIAAESTIAETTASEVTELELAQSLTSPVPVAQAVPQTAPTSEAIDQIQRYSEEVTSVDAMGQVTSISQLRDVQPTDWAFQALQSLVERYGCIAGYPDGTYRGNRALTRYEFAAGLNACLDRINELIAAATSNLLTREDLLTLQRLQEEFAAELATLRGRVDALEARTAELEANQFSTTTKLNGEAVFGLIGAFGDEKADGSEDDIEENATFGGRVRLNFDTSFTGRDRLRTRLQAGNVNNYVSATGTDMSRLGYATNTDNEFVLDDLNYRFPIGNRLTVLVGPVGVSADDLAPTFPSALNSSGNGAISRFAQYNPVFRLPDGNGITARYNFSDNFNWTVGYLTDDGNDPGERAGLFDGDYQAFTELAYVGDRFGLGVSYAHTYQTPGDVNLTGSTGSENAQRPFGSSPTSANVFGVQGQFRLSRRFVVGGWAGYWDAQEKGGDDEDADIWNWAGTLLFPDLGRAGNLGGIVIGMPPKATSGPNKDSDTGYHVEGFYRFRVSDNIFITPGVVVLLNPEHDDDNDTIYVGTLRTTFTF